MAKAKVNGSSPSEKRFESNLSKLREQKKLTQKTLAERAGLTVSYISMLERGSRSPPLATIDALAKALGVQPIDLIR